MASAKAVSIYRLTGSRESLNQEKYKHAISPPVLLLSLSIFPVNNEKKTVLNSPMKLIFSTGKLTIKVTTFAEECLYNQFLISLMILPWKFSKFQNHNPKLLPKLDSRGISKATKFRKLYIRLLSYKAWKLKITHLHNLSPIKVYILDSCANLYGTFMLWNPACCCIHFV